MTKEQIKEEFIADEMDYITAVEKLIEHCNMETAEAEELVESWEVYK